MSKLIGCAIAVIAAVALPGAAMAEGNLAKTPATALKIEITGKPAAFSGDPIDVETGKYYRLTITSDGGDEVLFTSPDLFNNVWLNQIVVAGAEIKMLGTGFKGVEVGEQGPNEVAITFVAVKPGDFRFYLNDDEKPAGTFHVH
jgi:hypothetical protein